MIPIIDGLKLAAGAILGGVVVYSYVQAFTLPAARSEARERLVAEQAVESQRQELERKGDDAKLQRMDDFALCTAYLGRVRECESLRVQPICSREPIAGRDGCPAPG